MPAVNFDLLKSKTYREENHFIKNVWKHNLHEEFHLIRQVIVMENIKYMCTYYLFQTTKIPEF